MNEMISFKEPQLVICHFRQDEMIAEQNGMRIVNYQAVIDNNKLSPSGDYVRFDCSDKCEINGWVRVDDIIIDEVLEKLSLEEKAA